MRLKGERLTWREVDGEIVALDLERSSYFTANSTASVLMKRLAEGAATPESLAKSLTVEFEVDEGTAASDVARFIDVLHSQDLLDLEDGA